MDYILLVLNTCKISNFHTKCILITLFNLYSFFCRSALLSVSIFFFALFQISFFGSQSRNRVQQSPHTFFFHGFASRIIFQIQFICRGKKTSVMNQTNHFQDESQHCKYKSFKGLLLINFPVKKMNGNFTFGSRLLRSIAIVVECVQ